MLGRKPVVAIQLEPKTSQLDAFEEIRHHLGTQLRPTFHLQFDSPQQITISFPEEPERDSAIQAIMQLEFVSSAFADDQVIF